MVAFETFERESWQLTAEGRDIVEGGGSHEVRVFDMIPADGTGIPASAIQVQLLFNISLRKKWANPARLDRCKPSRTSGLG